MRQRFAEKITCYSNNGNPKPIIEPSSIDPLPIVAVSVDMLDTGYDHKEIENLIMLRPTTSAMKYAQMRGRGSRLCPRIGKTEFLIYDFVNNHARFNDPDKRYHDPRPVGGRPGPVDNEDAEDGPPPGPPPPPPPPPPSREFTVIAEGTLSDAFRKRELIIVGPEGLEIDRQKYQDEWRKKVVEMQQSDPVVAKIMAGQEISINEWEALAQETQRARNVV